MHVYHYAPYEQTAFKRLMGRYATRENELDALLRGGRFVDLYAVVRQGLRAGIERYSIKNLEPLYGFTREVELEAARSRPPRVRVRARDRRELDAIAAEVRATVEGYNSDDCVSTLRLRDWLEPCAPMPSRGEARFRVPSRRPSEPSEKLSERQQRIEALRTTTPRRHRRRTRAALTRARALAARASPRLSPSRGQSRLVALLRDARRRPTKSCSTKRRPSPASTHDQTRRPRAQRTRRTSRPAASSIAIAIRNRRWRSAAATS